MFDYYFVDQATGEDFLVETDTYSEAVKIAKENFSRPKFIEKISVDEGEALGLDTY